MAEENSTYTVQFGMMTPEQLAPFSEEFAHFLALQGIDAEEWDRIKREDPKNTWYYLIQFSDIMWHAILRNMEWLYKEEEKEWVLMKFHATHCEVFTSPKEQNIKETDQTIQHLVSIWEDLETIHVDFLKDRNRESSLYFYMLHHGFHPFNPKD